MAKASLLLSVKTESSTRHQKELLCNREIVPYYSSVWLPAPHKTVNSSILEDFFVAGICLQNSARGCAMDFGVSPSAISYKNTEA